MRFSAIHSEMLIATSALVEIFTDHTYTNLRIANVLAKISAANWVVGLAPKKLNPK